jgi:prepilin-type processing-associated H-X9-DG protein
VLILLCRASPGRAAADDEARPNPSTNPAGAIAPFLDDQTVIVGRADLSAVDPAAIAEWVLGVAKDVKFAGQEDVAKQIGEFRPVAEKWLADFRKAGGREIYVLVNLTDLAGGGPVVVLPVAPGGDARALRRLMMGGGADVGADAADAAAAALPDKQVTRGEEIRGALVIGLSNSLRRLKDLKQPAVRPGLERALAPAAAGGGGGADAAVLWVLVPSAENRRVVEEMLPRLPEELGGGETATLTHGFEWASLAVQLPPRPSLRLVIQSKDAASARALAEAIRQLMAAAARAMVDGMPPDQRPNPFMVGSLIAALTPRPDGDRLVLSLDEPALRRLAGQLVAGPLGQARASAARAQSQNNMRQLLLACMLWSNDHKGEWPDNLATAAKAAGVDATNLLKNPSKPATGYTYLKPSSKDPNPSTTVAIYETDPSPEGRNVGFADGHVEFLKEPAFREAMKKK